jgi:outer membrane protein OmpA-like peptidoglycan-associated protein
MMRLVGLYFVGLLLLAHAADAQSSLSRKQRKIVRKADRSYEYLAYPAAAEGYAQVLEEIPSNSTLIRQLARCYHRLNDASQTAYWYRQLEDSLPLFTADDKLHYAQALASEQQYERAGQWYAAYGESSTHRQLANTKQSAFDQLASFYQDSAFYSLTPAAVNTEQSDFGPAYLNGGIVYASAREGSSSGKHYDWYDQAYLDLYYAPVDSLNRLGAPQRLAGAVNTRFHEGPATFYAGGRRMIFTRNNYHGRHKGRSKDYQMKLKLYTAQRDDTTTLDWTDVRPFPHNSDEYSSGHPTVSADGSRLYYVSDRRGGKGGTDIYVCQWQRNTWGRSVNLGERVNTVGNEMFPFIHPSGVLYFASDGRGGLGGLDIYRIDLNEENAVARNIGFPINSSYDDFGLIAGKDEADGFFSTNRDAGLGNDNVYHFRYRPRASLSIPGVVRSAQDSTPLAMAQVMLQRAPGDTLADVQTQADGTFAFILDWEHRYRVTATRTGYSPDTVRFSTQRGAARPDSVVLYLDQPALAAGGQGGAGISGVDGPEANFTNGTRDPSLRGAAPAVMVRGTTLNRATRQLLPGTVVTIENMETKATEQYVTDSAAQYRFAVSPDQSYRLRAERAAFIGANQVFGTQDTTGILTYDLLLDSIEVGKVVRLDRIFYDFDKWDIRTDAIPELEHLLAALRGYPSMKIELSSHTDVRGSDAYNHYLSSQRAQVVVSYLIAQGIRPDRMVSRGYGESKLTNGCSNGTPCTEEQHQENRRTEFMITEY